LNVGVGNNRGFKAIYARIQLGNVYEQLMKYSTKLLPLMSTLVFFGHFAAALGPGDLALVGFNADGDDNLAFVVLTDIPGGTEIRLSDNEWNGGLLGGTGAFLDNAESEITWTAPAGGVPAGTVVRIDGIETSAPLTTSTGAVAYTSSSNVGVGASGEAFFAYVGPTLAPTNFLTVFVSGAVSFAGSLNGTGLITGENAIALTAGSPDVAAYVGPRSGLASFAAYLPYLHSPTNWITEDGAGSQHNNGIAPEVPFDATPFTITPVGPEAPNLTIVPAGAGQATISWSPNSPGFILQETWGLTPANWTNSPSGATTPIVVPAVLPSKFYRLFKP